MLCGRLNLFIWRPHADLLSSSNMLLPALILLGRDGRVGGRSAGELVQRLVNNEKFKKRTHLLYQKQQIEENVWSIRTVAVQRRRDRWRAGVSLVDLVKVSSRCWSGARISRIELRGTKVLP